MSVHKAYNRLIKALEEFLVADYGFTRDGRTFRLFSPSGDAIVIHLQTSGFSDETSRLFYVNVAFVLAPHWKWYRTTNALPNDALRKDMHGIWDTRIGFTGFSGGDQWEVRDETTAETALERLKARLDQALPDIVLLLDRRHLRSVVDRGEFFKGRTPRIRAWLMAEEGDRSELERILGED